MYQQDYVRHNPKNNGVNYNPNKEQKAKFEHKMESLSTYKIDFALRKSDNSQSQKGKRPMTAHVPFCGSTSYNNQFVDWGSCQVAPMSVSKKIYPMPFRGQSTYKDCFEAINLSVKSQPIKSMY